MVRGHNIEKKAKSSSNLVDECMRVRFGSARYFILVGVNVWHLCQQKNEQIFCFHVKIWQTASAHI